MKSTKSEVDAFSPTFARLTETDSIHKIYSVYLFPGPKCACPNGQEPSPISPKTCAVPEAFMLFTRGKDIVRASVNPANSVNSEYPLPITPQDFVADASALDFDSSDGRIYWSDIQVSFIDLGKMSCQLL